MQYLLIFSTTPYLYKIYVETDLHMFDIVVAWVADS